jgi:hypothetical protein
MEHFIWTFVYFRPWMLALLLGSFAILFFTRRTGESGQYTWTILLFLLPAALFFLARPLIEPQQPLYIRRCIPVIFPLFFILTLQNWLLILKRFLKSPGVASVFFAVFVAILTGTFLTDTIQLIRTPLFAGVIEEIGTIGNYLPQNALVIIPANEAGLHMELPLQYSFKRETITAPGQDSHQLLASFLKRQMNQNRPVFLFTTKKNTMANPLPESKLEKTFNGQMIFRTLNPSKPDLVPTRLRTQVIRYEGFKIISPENTAQN